MSASPDVLQVRLAEIEERFRAEVTAAQDSTALEEIRVRFLGRSGEFTNIRRSVGTLPPAEKPLAGRIINETAGRMEAAAEMAVGAIRRRSLESSLSESIDVTYSDPAVPSGTIHPLRRITAEVVEYFARMGFATALGPQVETEYYNFDALNIPPDHPAREGFDSLYVAPGYLLRTHTSPMQIRMMQQYPAPIALVVPGAVFRRDAVDARHSYMFHQIEGLHVDRGLHMGHLKGALAGLCRVLFGPAQKIRFRPSFFPFTEPSAEVDTTCPGCGGSGCQTCSGSGWIEIGGAGMVHPRVLREAGYDPDVLSGWAFGIGVERIAMVRHGMNDIRYFYENERVLAEQLG